MGYDIHVFDCSQEEDERQQQLRERARKLIAEARQGITSPVSTPVEPAPTTANRKGSSSRSHSHSPSPAPSPTESIQKFLSNGGNRLSSFKNLADKSQELSRKCKQQTREKFSMERRLTCHVLFCSENSGQREEPRQHSHGSRARPSGHEPVHCERARNFGARTGENRSTGGRSGEEAAQADGGRKRLAACRQRDGRAAHAAVVHAGQQKERAHPAPDAAQHPVSFGVIFRVSVVEGWPRKSSTDWKRAVVILLCRTSARDCICAPGK